MLGLLAHGVHLLLLFLGLAGVTALLLPQLGPPHPGSRNGSYRRPTDLHEHDQRVATLRSAVDTGRLTATGRSAWAGAERDASLWRAVAVSSSAAAAVVHAAMFAPHLDQGPLISGFFLLSALAQAAWAYAVARRATSNLLLVGIFGNLAFIGLWAVTRTTGLPFGLTDGPEGVGGWDVSCVIWEWAVVLTCATGLYASAGRRRLVLGRLGALAWLWVVLSGIALMVLSLTVVHE